MLSAGTEVLRDLLVRTASVFKGVGQNRHAVEGTLGVDGFCKRYNGRSEPSGGDHLGAKRVAEDLSQETALGLLLAGRSCLLDCHVISRSVVQSLGFGGVLTSFNEPIQVSRVGVVRVRHIVG